MRQSVLYFLFSLCCLPVTLLAINHQALAQAASGEYGNEGKAIERVLRTQQNAWNRHDLEGFMAGYWKSDELTFFSGANVTRGWQATLDRYRRHYQSPGTEMGKLEFLNPSGSTNINNIAMTRLARTVVSSDKFNSYDVAPVTIQSGDFVVGFFALNPPNVYPIALDTSSGSKQPLPAHRLMLVPMRFPLAS